MTEVRQTESYAQWYASLRDRQAKVRIDIRDAKTLARHL